MGRQSGLLPPTVCISLIGGPVRADLTPTAFAQLRSASLRLSEQYARLLPRRRNAEETLHVALLCPSGPQYLVTLLACIRLGLGVLLLACVRFSELIRTT